jgi:hypothetical protein
MSITSRFFVTPEPTVTEITTGKAKDHQRKCYANAFNRTRDNLSVHSFGGFCCDG